MDEKSNKQMYNIDFTVGIWEIAGWEIVKIPWFAKYRKHRIKANPITKYNKKQYRMILMLTNEQVQFIQSNPDLIKQFLQLNGEIIEMKFYKHHSSLNGYDIDSISVDELHNETANQRRKL